MKKYICRQCNRDVECNPLYEVRFCMFCGAPGVEEIVNNYMSDRPTIDMPFVFENEISVQEYENSFNNVNTVSESSSMMNSPTLKRAFIFLQDGFQTDARKYFDMALDENPENAYAYMGKLLLAYNVKKLEDLEQINETFDGNYFYIKIMEYGDPELKQKISDALNSIKNRIETAKNEATYMKAANILQRAAYPKDYTDAAKLFESIIEYKNSKERYDFCVQKAEALRIEMTYANAMSSFNRMKSDRNLVLMNDTLHLFESISGYKDSDEYIQKCKKMIKDRISIR